MTGRTRGIDSLATALAGVILAGAQAVPAWTQETAWPQETVRPQETARPSPGLPKAVLSHLDRQAGCRHWGGEEPYDAARARAIAAAVRKLRCDALDADETRLRRLHAGSPAVLQALDHARKDDGG